MLKIEKPMIFGIFNVSGIYFLNSFPVYHLYLSAEKDP
jgi:hypothetical protein